MAGASPIQAISLPGADGYASLLSRHEMHYSAVTPSPSTPNPPPKSSQKSTGPLPWTGWTAIQRSLDTCPAVPGQNPVNPLRILLDFWNDVHATAERKS